MKTTDQIALSQRQVTINKDKLQVIGKLCVVEVELELARPSFTLKEEKKREEKRKEKKRREEKRRREII